MTSVEELDSVEFFSSIFLELLHVDKKHVSSCFESERASDSELLNSVQRTAFFSSSNDSLSIRTIPIHVFMTRSECVVMQKNINFGKSVIGDQAARKSVVLANRSSVPLLFELSKSRNIASQFMKLSPGGHRGVIPPKSSRSFHILFKPILPGNFEESLLVKNILNPATIESIVVKSVVLNPEKFVLLNALKPSNLPVLDAYRVKLAQLPSPDAERSPQCSDVSESMLEEAISSIESWLKSCSVPPSDTVDPMFLGEIFVGEVVETIVTFRVRNVTHKRRDFIIDAGHDKAITALRTQSCPFEPVADTLGTICALVCNFKELIENTVVHSSEVQSEYRDKLEKCKQDLKKAQRKNKIDKVAKFEAIIKKIERILSGGEITAIDYNRNEPPNSDLGNRNVSGGHDTSDFSAGNVLNFVKDSTVFHFQLEPEKEISLAISLRLIPGKSYVPWNGYVIPFIGQLRLFENRNEDFVKCVSFSALVHSHRPQPTGSDIIPASSANDSRFLHSLIYLEQPEQLSLTNEEMINESYLAHGIKCSSSSTERIKESELSVQSTKHKLFIVVVANWCSCQTNIVYPLYRSFKERTLSVSCKLTKISAMSSSGKNGQGMGKMHGMFSATSLFCGSAKLSMWLSLGELPAPEYDVLLPLENGPILVSVLSSHGESRHRLGCGEAMPATVDMILEEGETINFLIQWTPHSRDMLGLKFATLMAVNIEKVRHELNSTPIKFSPSEVKCMGSFLRVPIVCCMERSSLIKIEKYLNLGDVPLGSSVSAECTIGNLSNSESLHYVTNIVDLKDEVLAFGQIQIISGSTGVVVPDDTKNLEISFAAVAIGKFEQEILVTNMNEIFDQKRILVSATVAMPQSSFVYFPDVENDAEITEGMPVGMYFNLGLVQVSAATAARNHVYYGEENCKPFRISNVSSTRLYVTAHSNLKRQCFIFTDVAGDTPVVAMLLEPGVTSTVYVAIRRSTHFSDTVLAAQNKFGLDEGRAEQLRDLVGGVRFAFYKSDFEAESKDFDKDSNGTQSLLPVPSFKPTLFKLFETRPIRIKALLGCSVLDMYSCTERYRCVPSCHRGGNRMFRGAFVFNNLSNFFRLRYIYTGSYLFCFETPLPFSERGFEKIRDREDFKRTVPPGEIKFLLLDSMENIINPGCSEVVEFVVLFTDVKGVFSRTIEVLNSVTGDKKSLEQSFFFDPQKIVSSVSNKLMLNKSIASNINRNNRISRFGDMAGMRYAEGIFVTAVDCIHCTVPLWVDSIIQSNDSMVNMPKLKTVNSKRLPDVQIDQGDDSCGKLSTTSSLPVVVIGSSDPTGFMCEWTILNPLTIPVRMTPISDLPVLLTTKCISCTDEAASAGNKRFTANQEHNHSTVKKKYSAPTSTDVFSGYAFGQTASTVEIVKSDLSLERYVDRNKSIVTLPSSLWNKDLRRCGDTFTINPGDSVSVRLTCEVGGHFTDSLHSVMTLKQDTGSLWDAEGIVAFVSAPQTVDSFFTEPGLAMESADCNGNGTSDSPQVFGFTNILCKCITPQIRLPSPNITLNNLRSGQASKLSIEVANICDVDVPVAVKNLPDWMKIDRTPGTKYFGSTVNIAARSNFTINLVILKVPGRSHKEESVFRHEIYICNMCRPFSAQNYERTAVNIELYVQPSVSLILYHDGVRLPRVKTDISHSYLELGCLILPQFPCRSSLLTASGLNHYLPSANFSAVLSSEKSLFLAEPKAPLEFSLLPLSTTISIRNVMSSSVQVDLDIIINENFRDVLDIKMLYQGGIIPVRHFEMLPGESTEFTAVAKFSNISTASALKLPIFSRKLIRQHRDRLHSNPSKDKNISPHIDSCSSDDSDLSTSGDNSVSSSGSDTDEDESVCIEDEFTETVFLKDGHIVSSVDSLNSAVPEISSDLIIRSVFIGQLKLRPDLSGSNGAVPSDLITVNLVCDISLSDI